MPRTSIRHLSQTAYNHHDLTFKFSIRAGLTIPLPTHKISNKPKQRNPTLTPLLSSSSSSDTLLRSPREVSHAHGRRDANPLVAEDVHHHGIGLVVALWLEHGLVILVACHGLEVGFEEVGGVQGPAAGFGVELGGEDGAGFVDHSWRGVG